MANVIKTVTVKVKTTNADKSVTETTKVISEKIWNRHLASLKRYTTTPNVTMELIPDAKKAEPEVVDLTNKKAEAPKKGELPSVDADLDSGGGNAEVIDYSNYTDDELKVAATNAGIRVGNAKRETIIAKLKGQ